LINPRRRLIVLKELVEFLAKSLVNNPEEVSVSEVQRDETTLLQLRVAPSDLGRVIGKEGRTAKAIRLLLAAAAARRGKKATLEILE
jgi:predicted RNA-binding protein YlqC (UPF0109 family)